MSKNKDYTGIDCFRFIAALLIIAIHTSPLAALSETGDFILTRITARVAVPFFFMTSGFFMDFRYDYNARKLKAFAKKTLIIYGAAILIYIPINIYNGYFKMDNLLPNLIKDIVFDGTLYHLWYLPASITGAVIAWHFIRRLDYPKALAAAFVLYLIGLFGDSFYGITEKISSLKYIYDLIFQVSDYTRNGIFFAPVFIMLGGFIAENCPKASLMKNICGFIISFILMFVEAMILHNFDLQRHDSMYVFLLPCVYFLFNALLHFTGKRLAAVKTLSLIIYIIHPMIIVVIRLSAKLFNLQNLVIGNSIAHYLAVCLTSIVLAIAATTIWKKCKPKTPKRSIKTDRAYIEIDLKNLEHNTKILQKAMPPYCGLMAVLKANAYGHGAYEISTHLDRIGIRAFATATIDEAINLRKYGIRGEILILGYTNPQRAKELKKYSLTQTLIDYEYAKALNQQGNIVKAHIKIDTGMHRLGVPSNELSQIKNIFKMGHIRICGIYTHLCCSDSLLTKDTAYTKEQIDKFYNMVDTLKKYGIQIPHLHIQSSYGLWNNPELKCDYVRAGIALYGVSSAPEGKTKQTLDLRPVLALKARVILIRSVLKGESIGYARSFTTDKDTKIAILPIGYGDGIPRNLSHQKSGVIIRDKYAPIVGRICMDQLTVDVTNIENVSVGDIATLISQDILSQLSAPIVAQKADTISNELLCRLGVRLPVVVKE